VDRKSFLKSLFGAAVAAPALIKEVEAAPKELKVPEKRFYNPNGDNGSTQLSGKPAYNTSSDPRLMHPMTIKDDGVIVGTSCIPDGAMQFKFNSDGSGNTI